MKIWNSHIIMDKSVKWKDLEPVWGDMLNLFFDETRQFKDDPEQREIVIHENLVDIKNDRKPEGFNREGKMRIVVPLSDKREFFVYRGVYSDDVRVVTEKLSKFLAEKGIKHNVEWNDMLLYHMKKRRR